jgi:cobaltochelatase CobN
VHLSIGGCLGPCALSNVVMLLYAGREVWFHSVTGDEQIIAIFDYVEAMVRADRYLPPPPALTPQVFDVFDWEEPAPKPARAEPTYRDTGANGQDDHATVGLSRAMMPLPG